LTPWTYAPSGPGRGRSPPRGSATNLIASVATAASDAIGSTAGAVSGAPPDQAYLAEARQLQAISLGVHIPLVCFGIAFPAMVLFVEGMWLRTGDPVYRALAKRWSKVILVLFAVGVVTGTVLSFELGLLWPGWIKDFGAVFGVAFGLEGIAFFVEAIFIAIYVYGWDRLPRRAHLACGFGVLAAGIVGAFCVISVNGWMNDPTGFRVVGGKVVDVHPLRALFNGNMWHEWIHMYLAALMVAGFITAGVYALARLRGRRDRYHRIALVVPLTIAALAAPVQVLVGDWAGREVAERQPIKLAAMEGLSRSQSGAPFHLGGYFDSSTGEVVGGIRIPRLLSLLAFHDPNAKVTGLDSVPPGDRPPVNVVRYAFQTMVTIGTALAALAVWYLVVLLRRRRPPRTRWFERAVVLAAPLSVVALIAGWITTEVGRQPWIVYQVMRTEQAVTGAKGIPLGYGVLVAVYIALFSGAFWVLRRLARTPIDVELRPKRGDGRLRPASGD
jgi:cytochrome bd ubiquinol oxidase subunit I